MLQLSAYQMSNFETFNRKWLNKEFIYDQEDYRHGQQWDWIESDDQFF